MGIIKSFAGYVGGKLTTWSSDVKGFFADDKRWSDHRNIGSPDFTTLVEVGYKTNPWVYSCVNLTATTVAGLDWKITRERGDEIVDAEPNDPLVMLINRPNLQTSWVQYIKSLVTMLEISGKTYTLQRNPTDRETGRPAALWNIPPSDIQINKNPQFQAMIQDYTYRPTQERLDTSDLLGIVYIDPLDPTDGVAPLEAGYRATLTHNSAEAWLIALLENSGRPSNSWTTKDGAPLQGDQRKAAIEFINKMTQGSMNAGANVLADNLEPKPLSYPPMDMGIIDINKYSRVSICSCFGVPPILVGDLERSTFSNFEQAQKSYYQNKVLPLAELIAGELNVWFSQWFDSKLDFDRSNIEALQEDRNEQATRLQGYVSRGIIRRNEARSELGLEPEGTEADLLTTSGTDVLLREVTGETRNTRDEEPD